MSQTSLRTAAIEKYAAIFAALGDETRLSLVAKLSQGQPCSISQLADGSTLTRQAVTRHLQVLQHAGLVHNTYAGRQNLFELDLQPFTDMRDYLDFVSKQWDNALSRLQTFVEKDD